MAIASFCPPQAVAKCVILYLQCAPGEVVSVVRERIRDSLMPGQVLARYLLSPVNPADINVLQGTYPIRPALPATGGGEGVAEIVSTGGDTDLRPGDWVIPARPMLGTWRSHVLNTGDDWIRVRSDMPVLGTAENILSSAALHVLVN